MKYVRAHIYTQTYFHFVNTIIIGAHICTLAILCEHWCMCECACACAGLTRRRRRRRRRQCDGKEEAFYVLDAYTSIMNADRVVCVLCLVVLLVFCLFVRSVCKSIISFKFAAIFLFFFFMLSLYHRRPTPIYTIHVVGRSKHVLKNCDVNPSTKEKRKIQFMNVFSYQVHMRLVCLVFTAN